MTYEARLVDHLWAYSDHAFGDQPEVFDRPDRSGNRPSVFQLQHADLNLICPPDATAGTIRAISCAVPHSERHRWFRSMKSSQALAQSVFAGLDATGESEALGGLCDDDGTPLFPASGPGRMQLEKDVTYLGEPRPTSIDVWFDGPPRVAIECKLTEQQVGTCSRPRLKPDDNTYEQQYCNGAYTHQLGRRVRCSLTHIGVTYWDHIPELFNWDATTDLQPCPLAPTYQLVRNILAATVTDTGLPDPDAGFAVLVYDARNPANAVTGAVGSAYAAVSGSLREPGVLRRCSWQRIVAHLRAKGAADWLTGGLAAKYGIV